MLSINTIDIHVKMFLGDCKLTENKMMRWNRPYLPKYTLGRKRLQHIHPRVLYLAEQTQYDETSHNLNVKELCGYCTKKYKPGIEMTVTHHLKKHMMRCTGVEWVCQARDGVYRIQSPGWNNQRMMTKEEYSCIVRGMLKELTPTDMIYTLEHINMSIVTSQPHMQTMARATEYVVYGNFHPFKLKKEVFPVPPLGEEYVNGFVKPWKMDDEGVIERDDEGLDEVDGYVWGITDPYFHPELYNVKSFTKAGNYNFFVKNRQMNRTHSLSRDQAERALVQKLDKLVSANDPCAVCKERKMHNPDHIISCTGIMELCKFKYQFFSSMPDFLKTLLPKANTLMSCNTTARYSELMDVIFSVSYIERALVLKQMIDDELIDIHPHLLHFAHLYDMMILRYYSPVFRVPEEFVELAEGNAEEDVQIIFEDTEKPTPDVMSDRGESDAVRSRPEPEGVDEVDHDERRSNSRDSSSSESSVDPPESQSSGRSTSDLSDISR